MQTLHTYYDNLKVARNAPPEVIKAAYRVLSQKYHPDKNDGARNADAQRVMALINEAHDVLSDPVKRRTHDEWIRVQEHDNASRPPPLAEKEPPRARSSRDGPSATVPPQPTEARQHWRLSGRQALFAAVAAIVLISVLGPSPKPHASLSPHQGLPPTVAKDIPWQAPPGDQVVDTSPAGFVPFPGDIKLDDAEAVPEASETPKATTRVQAATFPTRASYIKGFPVEANGGLSTITIDNKRNESNVHVKLFSLEHSRAVRQIYIPAGGSFTAANIRAGSYEVRYKDLTSQEVSASTPFELVQVRGEGTTRFSNVTMTLFKVQNGNMNMRRITDAEF